MSRILSQATKLRLKNKRVDFLGTAEPFCSGRHGHPHRATATVIARLYEDGTEDTRATKDCTIDEPDFIARYQSKVEI